MDEGETSFGSLVFWRIVSETWKFFGSKTRNIVLAVLTPAVGFGVYWYFKGLPVAIDQLLSALMFTMAPVAFFVVSIFIWNLWLAPAALLYESHQRGASTGESLPPERIDWAWWRHREEYTLAEFSRILAHLDPTINAGNAASRAYAAALKEAMSNKKLKYVPTERSGYYENIKGAVTPGAKINRNDAIAWAKAKGAPVSHIEDEANSSPLFRPFGEKP